MRTKNTRNILIKNLLDTCIGAIVWWGWGFAAAVNPWLGLGYPAPGLTPCLALPHPARSGGGVELELVGASLWVAFADSSPGGIPPCAVPPAPRLRPATIPLPPSLPPPPAYPQYETGVSGNRFIGGTDRPRGFFSAGWVDVTKEGWEEHETGRASVHSETGAALQPLRARSPLRAPPTSLLS